MGTLISQHGGYRKLNSFQLAQLVYDITVRFCGRYVEKRSRTHDQMVQAARSGVQNIAEGSQASGTSTSSTQSTYPEIAANAALAPIVVATALLDRQLDAQARAFEKDDGFTERLYRTRKNRRDGASS